MTLRCAFRGAVTGLLLLPAASLANDLTARSPVASLAEEVSRLRAASDPESQLRLGDILHKGLPVAASNPLRRPDFAGARAAYRRAYDVFGPKRADAAVRLGKMLLRGEDGPRDPTQAERLLKQAIEAGNGEAAHYLARQYDSGVFGERDRGESEVLYRTAFRLGDASAGRALSRLLGMSTEAGRDTADATIKRLERNAADGRAEAAVILGDLYERGELVARDPARALNWYGTGAKLGSDTAYLRLARLHASDESGFEAPEKAREWVVKAAEAGRTDAALMIAIDGLFRGRFGFDTATSLLWLQRAEEAKDPRAQVLGFLHRSKSRTAGEDSSSDALTAQLAKLTISSTDLVAIGRLLLRESNNRNAVETAHILFKQAAASGNKDGDYWIGRSVLATPAMFTAESRKNAIERLDEAVRAGHGPAAASLADAYRYGVGVEPSLEKAAELYEKAIARGRPADSVVAMLAYASMLRKEGDADDVEKAIDWYQRAADRGNVEALVVLGRMFLEGREVRRDLTTATLLMRRAIENGSTEAMIALADHLAALRTPEASEEAQKLFAAAWARRDFRGLSRLVNFHEERGDVAKATKLLEEAARKGSLEAALQLFAVEARKGRLDEARRWRDVATGIAGISAQRRVKVAGALLKADQRELKAEADGILKPLAAQEDVPAMVMRGKALLDGRIADADRDEGLRLLERATDLGSNDGRLALADALRRGRAGTADLPRAVETYEDVIEADPANAIAALALARAYERGEGVTRDRAKAMAFYHKAAKLGSTAAMGLLGSAYAEGIGVPRDPMLAEVWLKRATEADDVNAVEALARFYASGASGRPAAELAFNEYLRAARLGSAKAMLPIGRMLLAGTGVERNSAAALDWIGRAAASDVDAKIELARLYTMGAVTRKDLRAARELLTSAAETGNVTAMHRLGVMLSDPDSSEYDRDSALKWLEKAVAGGHDSAKRDVQRLRGNVKSK